MVDDIDLLLARFEQEIAWFIDTRDRLLPVLEMLDAALAAHVAVPSPGSAAAARAAREAYVRAIAGIEPTLREWVAISGSSDLLWEAEPAMSDAQAARFEALLARELAASWDRDRFDLLLDSVRRGLLVFEESTD
jgi:hypothetical protein